MRDVKILKVLFVVGAPNPFPGAAWTRIGFFANAWSKSGHSVEVLGTFSYRTHQQKGTQEIRNTMVLNLIPNLGLLNPPIFILNSIAAFAVSALLLLVRKPNVTVISVPAGDVGLGAIVACRLFRAEHVIDYRDEWEYNAKSLAYSQVGKCFCSVIEKLNTILYSGSRLVVAVTSNLVQSLKCRGLSNVRHVPNGADLEVFKPSDNRRDNMDFTVIYTGLIGQYYRVDLAVRSMKKCEDMGLRNVRMFFAGSGETDKLLKLAAELGIASKVEYKGVITDKSELAQLMARADVGLIPYDDNPLWKNSLPTKFFEYCACGLPIVATAHEDSLLASLINEYAIDVTSPPLNAEKLAEAVYWIHGNKSFREAAGKRARLLVEEKFDRNNIADQFLDLLKVWL